MPSLPARMLPPRIFRISDAVETVMTLAVSPKPDSHLSMEKVRQLADNEIQEALLRVRHVADAEVFGGFKPEIRISVDRDKIAGYNLTVEHVLAPVAQQHKNTPSGTLYRDNDRVLIKIEGEKKYREELGDIAEISTTHEELDSFFRGNGKTAIGINLLRAESGHVTPAIEAAEQALAELEKQFSELRFEVADTQGELIRTSVSNLLTSLRDAIILTICVMFLFLARVRITLLATLSIPVLVPIMFVGGYPEKILRPLTVVLCLALASSFIASVTVIPLLGSRLLKGGGIKNRLEQGIERIRNSILSPLQRFVTAAFRAGTTRWFFLIAPLLILLLLAGLRQMPIAGRDLMPPMDTGLDWKDFRPWPWLPYPGWRSQPF